MADVIDHAVHFAFVALHDEFDAAIGEVSHVAGDVVTLGDVVGGVPEAHTLHMSAEVVSASFHPPAASAAARFCAAQSSTPASKAPSGKFGLREMLKWTSFQRVQRLPIAFSRFREITAIESSSYMIVPTHPCEKRHLIQYGDGDD